MVKKKKKKTAANSEIAKIEQLIKKSVEKHGEKLTEEEKSQQIEALKKVFIEGKTAAEALNVSDEILNLLYKVAFDQYNLGLYEDSNKVFRMLCMFEPYSPRYRMGLAATNHQMGNYEAAVPFYYCAYLMDAKSPVPLVHISDCYLKMNQPEAAYFILKVACVIAEKEPKYSRLKTRCYQMMKELRARYGIHPEEEVKEEVDEADIFSQLQSEAGKKKDAA